MSGFGKEAAITYADLTSSKSVTQLSRSCHPGLTPPSPTHTTQRHSPDEERDTSDVNPYVRGVGMVSTVKGELVPQVQSGRCHFW